jgi:hypothetical protein
LYSTENQFLTARTRFNEVRYHTTLYIKKTFPNSLLQVFGFKEKTYFTAVGCAENLLK